MGFEPFSRAYGYRPRKGFFLSITKNGSILFSTDFYQKYMSGYKGIELLYDKSRNVIGLKPVKELTEAAYPIRQSGKVQKGKKIPLTIVYMATFFKYFEIDHSTLKRYIPTWDEKENLFEIDLNAPM
jgi:hypothetical protein